MWMISFLQWWEIMNEFLEECRRNLSEMWKYKFNLIFANLGMLIIFYGLTTYIYEDSKDILIFLLFIWYFATHGIMNSSYELENEIYDRTIVTIIQSKVSVLNILIKRAAIQIIMDLVKAIPLFLILYYISDINFYEFKRIDYIIIAITLAIINSYVLGLLFSGLAFIFRRVTNVISLSYYYILFYGGLTVDIKNPVLSFINNTIFPYTTARSLIEQSKVGFGGINLIVRLLVQTAIMYLIAYIFQKICLRHSLKKGSIYGI